VKPAVGFTLPSAGVTPAPSVKSKAKNPGSGFGSTPLLLFFSSKFLQDLFPL
jgi:hypothetical protein